jgi:hypothetical protein
VHSGELKLSITNASYLGVRQNWGDRKKQRLENLIESFTKGVAAAGAAMKARRLEREGQAGKFEEAQALGAYLVVVVERSSSLATEERQGVDAWIEWLKQTIEELDPLSRGLPTLMSEDEAYSNSWRSRD